MSNKTRSGKKTKQPLPQQAISPMEPQIIKVEFSPLPTQVVELKSEKETKQGTVNWDVFGVLATGVTLFGTAFLFILGWAYEVNWYGYFGVSMFQVNSLPQDVIIQSIPSIITLFSILVAIVIVYSWWGFQDSFFLSLKSKHNSQETKEISLTVINSKGWLIVLFFTELILLLVFYSAYTRATKYGNLNTIYEIYYLDFLGMPLLVVGIPLFSITILVLLLAKIVIKKKLHLILPTPQKSLIWALLIFSLIFTLVATSAIYAINDAAKGLRGSGGWNIQPVSLITPKKLVSLKTLDQICDDTGCISGPFGLIGENENSYLLVKWKEDSVPYYKYHPGVYILPKNDQTYLVPFSAMAIFPTPQPRLTPTPTFTATVKPTMVLTVSSTPTPTIRKP